MTVASKLLVPAASHAPSGVRSRPLTYGQPPAKTLHITARSLTRSLRSWLFAAAAVEKLGLGIQSQLAYLSPRGLGGSGNRRPRRNQRARRQIHVCTFLFRRPREGYRRSHRRRRRGIFWKRRRRPVA